MKQDSLSKAYFIYFVACIAIIFLYLYSTVSRESAEILNQPVPIISQYYDLKTVAIVGFGLNLFYSFYTKNKSKFISKIHFILALFLLLVGLFGIISITIPK
jgi:hypothetical protein